MKLGILQESGGFLAKGAEKIYESFQEGDWITVHSSAKVDNYTDSEGNKRSKVRFRVNEFEYPQWQDGDDD